MDVSVDGQNLLCCPCAAVKTAVHAGISRGRAGRSTGRGGARKGRNRAGRARTGRARARTSRTGANKTRASRTGAGRAGVGHIGTGRAIRTAVQRDLAPHMGRNVGTRAIAVEVEAVHVDLVSHGCGLQTRCRASSPFVWLRMMVSFG